MKGCEVCTATDKLFQCARCRRAFYCSKKHQKSHWKQHKVHCNIVVDHSEKSNEPDVIELSAKLIEQLFVASENHSNLGTLENIDGNQDSEDSGPNRLELKSDDLMHLQSSSMHIQDDPTLLVAASTATAMVADGLDQFGYSGTPLYQNARLGVPSGLNSPEWVQAMCQHVIRDLDSHGICVIDNFLGNELGAAILSEVLGMYESGEFVDGKLMNKSSDNISRVIRGDKIHWVTGHETHCKSIAQLIRLVDSVVLNSNRMVNNGKLGQYVISDRSKAMVACYPGEGAAYVKHVDNPNKDGRCVTSIYYLNKDWHVKKDGGLLRIFPRDGPHVADIEPLFDRILFFWSDRRNPHEVQPANRTRYAITLWYHDKQEREAALKDGHK